MLNIQNLSKSFGVRSLYTGVNLNIGARDRLALLGPNGSGKTTLFEMIAGRLEPDEGKIILRRGTTVGYLEQDIKPSSKQPLLKAVSSASDRLRSLSHKISLLQGELAEEKDGSESNRLMNELGELQHSFEALGGYNAEQEAKLILAGLGFKPADFDRPLHEFSGGWLMRAELAKLLFLSPDILILDEPTNHLDLESTRWFESYLKQYSGSVLFTSHDRAFLNSIATKILSLEEQKARLYTGNYDSYLRERELRLTQLESQSRRQQELIDKETKFIERFRYKATKASQVQSRIKKLDKLSAIVIPRQTKKMHFNFPEPERSGHDVIKLRNLTKSYGDMVIYQGLELVLNRGDKVALVGPNGAGKTTLLKILAGVMPFDSGYRNLGVNVNTAYFAQYYVESLCPSNNLIQELETILPDAPEQQLRGMLGAFLFSGDDVKKRISVLSGGEKTRLAIAKMLLKPANLVLMDEPTNHLDIPAREILADALQAYKGTLCFITHDRTLIREVATKIIEVRNGKIRVFEGDYDAYLEFAAANPFEDEILKNRTAVSSPRPAPVSASLSQKQRKTLEGQIRNQHYKETGALKQEISDTEEEITGLEKRKQELETLLADPDLYRSGQKVADASLEYKNCKERLIILGEKWLKLCQQNDTLKQKMEDTLKELDN